MTDKSQLGEISGGVLRGLQAGKGFGALGYLKC